MIHATFPVLPHSKDGLRVHLGNAHAEFVGVFFQALHLAVRSSIRPNEISQAKMIKSTALELQDLSLEKVVSPNDVMILVQSWTLMAIQAENNHALANQGSMLASAIQKANQARFFDYNGAAAAGGPDTEIALVRRIWLSLVTLDRLGAVGNARPILIPQDSVVLYPSDNLIVSGEFFQMLRKYFPSRNYSR